MSPRSYRGKVFTNFTVVQVNAGDTAFPRPHPMARYGPIGVPDGEAPGIAMKGAGRFSDEAVSPSVGYAASGAGPVFWGGGDEEWVRRAAFGSRGHGLPRSTRMPWRTIRAPVRAKRRGPSRVPERDGYSSRRHLCIELQCAHRGVWRLRPEEEADAAHSPSRAPGRRWLRSRGAPMPGSNRQPFCNPQEELSRVHPKYAGPRQGALPSSCRGRQLLPA